MIIIRVPLLPIRATCPVHLILLDLITLITLGEEYKSRSCSLRSFLRPPRSKYSPEHPVHKSPHRRYPQHTQLPYRNGCLTSYVSGPVPSRAEEVTHDPAAIVERCLARENRRGSGERLLQRPFVRGMSKRSNPAHAAPPTADCVTLGSEVRDNAKQGRA
jgi:hypothetical protein